MAEDLTDYLLDKGIRVRYLHSDIDTLRRVELLRELRTGVFDVLVGINLLREGLDLPEVSLVSILDADKEGFLRSARIAHPDDRPRRPQRLRAGAHVCRQDHALDAARARRDEPPPREADRLQPRARASTRTPLRKKIADITDLLEREDADTQELIGSGRMQSRGKSGGGRGAMAADVGVSAGVRGERPSDMAAADLSGLIQELTDADAPGGGRAALRARGATARRDRAS